MAAAAGAATRHTVFVYGTLKRGYTNYELYLDRAVRRGGAEFIGPGKSVDRYPLVIGTITGRSIPYLINDKGNGYRITGELFEVDDSTLSGLDILEGVASGHYFRSLIDVESPDGSVVQSSIYLRQADPQLLELPKHECYTDEHHALYRPGSSELNQDICRKMDGEL